MLTEQKTMQMLKEAKFWKKLDDKVQCHLCNRHCVIEKEKFGSCKVRKNIDRKLYSLVYGKPVSLAIDPIEKKPLFHFRPTTRCLSFGTYGCNFHCKHCQNYDISNEFTVAQIESIPYTSPKEIVDHALNYDLPGIAYTYTEPTIFAEYALDTMKLAKENQLYNVWVSNGYATKELWDDVIPYLDAVNIDLKGNEKFYEEICGNIKRRFVLESIKYLYKKGVHLEVTNLVIPTMNDSDADFEEVAEFLAGINPEIPFHITAFYPAYLLTNLPRTDTKTLSRGAEAAKKHGLKYVYTGNTPEEENSYCKNCGNLLIKRVYFSAEIVGLDGKKCKKCGTENNFIV